MDLVFKTKSFVLKFSMPLLYLVAIVCTRCFVLLIFIMLPTNLLSMMMHYVSVLLTETKV